MGMALLRRMKKGGGRAGGPLAAAGPAMPEPALALPPHPQHGAARHSGGPVVHIHIGPNASPVSEAEGPEEDLGDSPAEEGAELPPPILLRKLHDKIQAARAARK